MPFLALLILSSGISLVAFRVLSETHLPLEYTEHVQSKSVHFVETQELFFDSRQPWRLVNTSSWWMETGLAFSSWTASGLSDTTSTHP